jgi:hypothetical protein
MIRRYVDPKRWYTCPPTQLNCSITRKTEMWSFTALKTSNPKQNYCLYATSLPIGVWLPPDRSETVSAISSGMQSNTEIILTGAEVSAWRPAFRVCTVSQPGGPLSYLRMGRTIAQAAARVRTRVRSCGQSGTGPGFLRLLRFPLPIGISATRCVLR